MPRKSAAERAMEPLRVDGRPARLKPPASLSPRERELFLHIVNTNPPEHFRPSDIMLLSRYVESAALAEKAALELRKGAVIDGKANAWLIPQEKAVRAMIALCARLRLSPQSRLDPKTVGEKVRARPWLDDDEEDAPWRIRRNGNAGEGDTSDER